MSGALRVGVIGWLRYYDNEHGRTVAACDVRRPDLEAFQARRPDVAIFEDYREMAERARLDAVIISTPNWLHREMAECFLRRGAHVFMEKPMGVNRAEIDSVARTQRDAGRICAVDFELRVSPAMKRVREIVRSGEIGALHGIEFIHHRGAWLAAGNGGWRTDPARSGGLFLMEICHEVDIFRHLFGEVTHVQCFSHRNLLPQYPAAMPDNVYGLFWFEGGRMGAIVSSHTASAYDAPKPRYAELGHDMAFVITGTEGCLRIECISQKILVCRYEEFHPDAPAGRRVAFRRLEDYAAVGNFHHDITANHLAFLESCALGRPFHQDTLDAWRTHVVCLAAERSAVEGGPKLALDYALP
jgi:predicted dehydrogenase